MEKDKKILYSAMQPSGVPSLGNYLGALKNWKNLQEDYNCIFGVANMHAITVRQNPTEFRRRIRDLFTLFLGVLTLKKILCMFSLMFQLTQNCLGF